MKHFLSILLLLSAVSCASPQITVPDGFVRFTNEEERIVLASPDGVIIRVRELDEESIGGNADPGLWMKEVDIVLKNRGYTELKNESVSWGGGSGKMSRYRVMFNNTEYRFMVAVVNVSGRLFLFTGAGDAAEWESRTDEITQACESLQIKQ